MDRCSGRHGRPGGRGRLDWLRSPVGRDARGELGPLLGCICRQTGCDISAHALPHPQRGVGRQRCPSPPSHAVERNVGDQPRPGQLLTRKGGCHFFLVGSQPRVNLAAAPVGPDGLFAEEPGGCAVCHAARLPLPLANGRVLFRRWRDCWFRPGAMLVPSRCHVSAVKGVHMDQCTGGAGLRPSFRSAHPSRSVAAWLPEVSDPFPATGDGVARHAIGCCQKRRRQRAQQRSRCA